ncbi:peptide chain release factor 2 [Pseudazoarcus pumilus]|uniref:Peptide chain release factor 2 n=1 Tax=Pseudazoarcus pumilus TaxID=2067960 RepID=A0A2I6SAZ1_9RHOO|nr:peptide chain release factor 2 [Pseudazoarcus pumilus]
MGSLRTGRCRYTSRSANLAKKTRWKPNASTPSPRNSPTSRIAGRNCGGIFDYDEKATRLRELNLALEDPAVWNDPDRAQELGKEKRQLEDVVLVLDEIASMSRDLRELFELAEAEDDEDTIGAVETDLATMEAKVLNLEFRRMFSNPMDPSPCFVEIQAGAGGTEAQDWAGILERMYLRYCERKGFTTELLEESEGEVAGIKSATFKVDGDHAYGFLRTETGIHRLVRKSPFDSNARRHTSFCSVFVYPEVDDSIEIEINPADLRVDTYRASGAGGQHINKTDSAIRITHEPTGIVVQCQNDRSQHKNRAAAMAMLKARLYESELRKRQTEQQALEDSKSDIGWGHQIRSYVLDQSRIKDLRTNFEVGNTQAVLDGDLDDFIAASLKQGV